MPADPGRPNAAPAVAPVVTAPSANGIGVRAQQQQQQQQQHYRQRPARALRTRNQGQRRRRKCLLRRTRPAGGDHLPRAPGLSERGGGRVLARTLTRCFRCAVLPAQHWSKFPPTSSSRLRTPLLVATTNA
ncbi:MAG: hypothetical protein BJ554DRAFT_949 [Olpidium bornovanus]|uniref:Uncharacterized protein n=1 Tax=Olpidium bornovanus TaxID=278681 RepID=A0A8H7ZSM4_9FUNG|nr:MAG: hypothetical protein BJ554DRAFT_949 [Olpidium bornovanus]